MIILTDNSLIQKNREGNETIINMQRFIGLMRLNTRAVVAGALALALIANLVLFGIGVMTPLGFWVIIGISFAFSWYLNKHKP
jgi:hypothetical protein